MITKSQMSIKVRDELVDVLEVAKISSFVEQLFLLSIVRSQCGLVFLKRTQNMLTDGQM